jgi:hypothetical protein
MYRIEYTMCVEWCQKMHMSMLAGTREPRMKSLPRARISETFPIKFPALCV